VNYSLSVTDIEDAQNRAAIGAPLREYNDGKAGPSQYQHLAVLLKDSSGSVIGGLWGSTSYDWLTVYLLAVPSTWRGHGVGTEIMRLAEAEAGQRGCYGVWLDTIEFQARGFYERLGYVCFGELPNYPAGFSKFFMRKFLVRPHEHRRA
jgi:GNAT superfamily N-acetyltransferase